MKSYLVDKMTQFWPEEKDKKKTKRHAISKAGQFLMILCILSGVAEGLKICGGGGSRLKYKTFRRNRFYFHTSHHTELQSNVVKFKVSDCTILPKNTNFKFQGLQKSSNAHLAFCLRNDPTLHFLVSMPNRISIPS